MNPQKYLTPEERDIHNQLVMEKIDSEELLGGLTNRSDLQKDAQKIVNGTVSPLRASVSKITAGGIQIVIKYSEDDNTGV